MMIRCPKCDRMGYLPDRLAPEAHSLRCRKCKANFTTTELAVKEGKQRRAMDGPWRDTALDSPGASPSRQKATPFLAEGIFDRFEESQPPRRALGPGDSNYEMTFTLDDATGDSVADWEKDSEAFLEPEAPSSDEIEAMIPKGTGSSNPDPGFYGFIVSWRRPLCFGVLGFVAFSVLVIGFLVASSLGMTGIQAIPTSIQALIVASLGTIALLLIGTSMIFQIVCLADLARSVHRMHDLENRLSGR
jgi:hypothetical protein